MKTQLLMDDKPMEHTYVVRCGGCGYMRDCGYMAVTADRLADWHRERGPQHNVTVEATGAEPLTQRVIRARQGGSYAGTPPVYSSYKVPTGKVI